LDLRDRGGYGDDFGIDTGFAYPPGYELGVWNTTIDYKNKFTGFRHRVILDLSVLLIGDDQAVLGPTFDIL